MTERREYQRIYARRRRALERLGLKLSLLEGTEQLVMDSRQVAEIVEKRHSDLIRDIRRYEEILEANPELDSPNLEANADLRSPNLKVSPNLGALDFFIPSTYRDAQGKTRTNYQLTKQGCEMVANKMTGEKGILFTAMYVSRFNEMEGILKEKLPSKREKKKLVETSSEAFKLHLTAVKVTADMLGADKETLFNMIKAVHEYHGIPTNHLAELRGD